MMQDPGWQKQVSLQVEEICRILRSLAMYSPGEARKAEAEVLAAFDALRRQVSSQLAARVEAVLEDKNLNLEDEDSSIDIHMLRRLKVDAESLSA